LATRPFSIVVRQHNFPVLAKIVRRLVKEVPRQRSEAIFDRLVRGVGFTKFIESAIVS
jgi:hypothetical protein